MSALQLLSVYLLGPAVTMGLTSLIGLFSKNNKLMFVPLLISIYWYFYGLFALLAANLIAGLCVAIYYYDTLMEYYFKTKDMLKMCVDLDMSSKDKYTNNIKYIYQIMERVELMVNVIKTKFDIKLPEYNSPNATLACQFIVEFDMFLTNNLSFLKDLVLDISSTNINDLNTQYNDVLKIYSELNSADKIQKMEITDNNTMPEPKLEDLLNEMTGFANMMKEMQNFPNMNGQMDFSKLFNLPMQNLPDMPVLSIPESPASDSNNGSRTLSIKAGKKKEK